MTVGGAARALLLRDRVGRGLLPDQPDLLPLVIGDVVLAMLLDVVEQRIGQVGGFGDGQVITDANDACREGDGADSSSI